MSASFETRRGAIAARMVTARRHLRRFISSYFQTS